LRETAEKTDLSIKDGKILSFSRAEAREVIDAAGSFVSCGFIESHLHVEGLHLLPDYFFEAFLRHGTTTIITDLHEIANAGGMAGFLWYLSRIDQVPLDLFVMAPSCVPSSPYELGAAKLGVRELRRLRNMRRVLGLGEVMDVEAVVARHKGVMAKIALFEGRPVDGHAPGLTGRHLDLYMSAGIYSDHETTGVDEGEEKLRRGMHLFLREGSVAKDLEALLPLVRPETLANLSLCTDDLSARDLHETGHLDRLVARIVRSGISPIHALSLVTRMPALYFNLNDRNAPALGRKADLVLFDDPLHMRILATVKAGKVVSREGEGIGAATGGVRRSAPPRQGLKLAPFRKEDLRRKPKGGNIRVMAVREGTILVKGVTGKARIEEGYLACDHERDIVFAYVFDRYRAEALYGFGFVTGFSLRHGALGTTYAHDSHNLVILGDNPADIFAVREVLEACGGGMAASHSGSALAVPMPYFGIISDLDAQAFLKKEAELDRLVRMMGVRLKNPFFQMSFLSLPVIPELRLTTKGLFHVGTERYVESNY
jgi:adenine deaminase